MRDVNGYMELPYTVVVRKDEEGDYVATVDELPGCIAHGATRLEALECLDEIQQAWLSECIAQGQPVPEPRPDQGLPSGKWVQRVPRSLHLKLSRLARTESVSLNQLVTGILAEAVGERTTTKKAELTRAPASSGSYWALFGDEVPKASLDQVIPVVWAYEKHPTSGPAWIQESPDVQISLKTAAPLITQERN